MMCTKSIHTASSCELQAYLLSLAGHAPKQNERKGNNNLISNICFMNNHLTKSSKPRPSIDRQGDRKHRIGSSVKLKYPRSNRNNTRWAGSAFENCPPPEDLPLPVLLTSSQTLRSGDS